MPDVLPATSELPERIRVAGLMATMARRSLDVWWTYQRPDSHARHIMTMNEYPHFFRADIQAHLVMAVVTLVTLFDSSDNTVTIRHIVHKAVADGHKSLKPFQPKVDGFIDDKRVAGLTLLRNKLFAHRDRDASYDQTFKEAEVRPNDMIALSDETFEIINTVAETVGARIAVHDTITAAHTEAMLLKLRTTDP